tara:strand:- start:531 stop:1385 length:855 start_codon:yes stop_codon:yes gene_type:complete
MFSGNQLAVVPEAQGLSESQMQNIAKEFNFSETTFVFPPEAGQTKKVRIFTPNTEVPFAGHPNIGTAFILAKDGAFGTFDTAKEVVFEEKAGLVPVKINKDESGYIWCELSAPEILSIGDPVSKPLVASVLTLNESEILTTTHPPQVASVGLPFLLVEISSVNSLIKAQIDVGRLELLIEKAGVSYIHLYCRNVGNFDIKARMFAPLDGVSEDPATGSANGALIGLLSQYENIDDSDKDWTISQGAEIGRPSVLYGRTQKQKGKVIGVWIGGHSVLVSEGVLKL